MQVVCNSSVLIALSRIGFLWVIEKLFGKLIIPEAVYFDVVVKGSGKVGAEEVASADWIHIKKVKKTIDLEKISSFLHQGESEAILLAEEIEADIIILDDNLARETAKTKGLNVIGTIAVLHHAKEKGFIPKIKPILDSLIKSGFYIGDEYDRILKDAGEV